VEPGDGQTDGADHLEAYAQGVRIACAAITDPEERRAVVRALIRAVEQWTDDRPLVGAGR
jgi:hypothetical protein